MKTSERERLDTIHEGLWASTEDCHCEDPDRDHEECPYCVPVVLAREALGNLRAAALRETSGGPDGTSRIVARWDPKDETVSVSRTLGAAPPEQSGEVVWTYADVDALNGALYLLKQMEADPKTVGVEDRGLLTAVRDKMLGLIRAPQPEEAGE